MRPPHVFYIDEEDIGASKGNSTNIIRFDIDYSTPTVHCHPRCLDEVISPLLITYANEVLRQLRRLLNVGTMIEMITLSMKPTNAC